MEPVCPKGRTGSNLAKKWERLWVYFSFWRSIIGDGHRILSCGRLFSAERNHVNFEKSFSIVYQLDFIEKANKAGE